MARKFTPRRARNSAATETRRVAWPPGPWDDEPDEAAWRDPQTGAPCAAMRNLAGSWCGYVILPPRHRLAGRVYSQLPIPAHWGLTYSGPKGGGWALGFDCAHYLDLSPALEVFRGRAGRIRETAGGGAIIDAGFGELVEYRTLDYVRRECAQLARNIDAYARWERLRVQARRKGRPGWRRTL